MLVWFLYWCLSLSLVLWLLKGMVKKIGLEEDLQLKSTALPLALEQNSMEPASQSPTHPGPFCLHYGNW